MPLTPLGHCHYQIDLRSLKSVDDRSHLFTYVSHLCSICDALWHDQLNSWPRESHNVTERDCELHIAVCLTHDCSTLFNAYRRCSTHVNTRRVGYGDSHGWKALSFETRLRDWQQRARTRRLPPPWKQTPRNHTQERMVGRN